MNKLEQIREYMNRNDIDGVLLISPENVRWLSGFSGDSAQILVTQNHQYFITDCRYIEQAEREMGDTFRYIKAAHAERLRRIDKLLDKHGTKCLGIEKEVVTISHVAQSRGVFADGAVQAALFLDGCEPGYYTMTDMLKGKMQCL